MITLSETARKSFEGRSVLLTGASGGLGKELAKEFAKCGVSELVLSGRNEASLKEVEHQCLALCPTIKTHIFLCDLSSKESVKSLGMKVAEECPAVDILVNNGGVSSRSNFLDTDLSVDEKVMQINFFAGAALAKAIVPNMIKKKSGRIIWISSVQGKIGIPSRTSYAASKFAVQGYCESLRAEVATSGITVRKFSGRRVFNYLYLILLTRFVDIASPGYIRTGLSFNAVTGDGGSHGRMDDTTLNGADPNDVAVKVLENVANGNNDFLVASPLKTILAIWLRWLFPSFLERQLVRRFEKGEKEKSD